MPVEHLKPSEGPERVAEILARDGCVVVDRLAEPEHLDRVRAELAPYLEATPTGRDGFAGRKTRRTGGLVARSETAREIIQDPLVLDAVKRVLARATSFRLHLTQVIAIAPGQEAQPIHRDQWAFDFFPFPTGYEIQCNTLWAMTDFTERNGATRVVPGSHLYEDKLELGPEATEPAEMEAGSALFYTGALYHGGGANRSDAVRYGLNITYAVSWLRQEENQYLSVPREIAATLDEPLLRLIGYARGAYALGYVDDLRDPIEVVRPDAAKTGFGDLDPQRIRAAGEELMPNVAMWGRALQGMPRLGKQEWDGLDLVSRWLIATRSAVIVMTFTSAAFGGLLAFKAGKLDPVLFALVTAGLCLAHATNNLANDLIDHWKGVDAGNYFRTQYGPQTVEAGFLSVGQLLIYAAATGLAALAIGLYLVTLRGETALWLLGVGAFFVVFYTWPLKYIGLGEPAVLAVWGPLMVGGSYFVITGEWSHPVAVASLAYALGPTAVLFGKHIDKLEADQAKGIRTLPVILGERSSRFAVMGMLVAQLAVIAGLVATGFFTPAMLIALLPAPWLRRVWSVYREPRPEGPPDELPAGVWPLWFVASAFWYTRRFGAFFVVALLADLVVSRI